MSVLGAYTRNVTAQARKLLEQALSLPEDDRQRLAEALLDSIPAELAEELEKAWNAEALRRAEPIHLSATPFCQGALRPVMTGSMSMFLIAVVTRPRNLSSRS